MIEIRLRKENFKIKLEIRQRKGNLESILKAERICIRKLIKIEIRLRKENLEIKLEIRQKRERQCTKELNKRDGWMTKESPICQIMNFQKLEDGM